MEPKEIVQEALRGTFGVCPDIHEALRELSPRRPKDPKKLRRLLKAMQWVAILSENEALSAITAHRQNDGRYGGSEAVVHFGGPTAVIQAAIKTRRLQP